MRYWTIHTNGRSFTINSRHLIFISLLGLFILLSSIFSLFQLINSNLDTSQFIRRKERQEALMSALQCLEGKLKSLHKGVNSLVDWDRKVRLVWGIPEIDEDIRKLGTGGRGPIWSRTNIVDRIGKSTEELKKKLDFELTNCKEISEDIRKVKKLLSATPSIWPASGVITSGFGWRHFRGRREFHKGLDIANHTGTPIVTAASGVVTDVKRAGAFGLMVEIDHGFGYTTRYGHLLRASVVSGQRLERGTIIGYMGRSGRATGTHLHYEVKVIGKNINPLKYIISGKTTY